MAGAVIRDPQRNDMAKQTITSLGEPVFPSPLKQATGQEYFVPSRIRWRDGQAPDDAMLFESAGPRDRLFFDPATVHAGIVTCGGLCPGLNNVIRSVFLELYHAYGVTDVVGFRGGYGGLDPAQAEEPFRLTPALVSGIHKDGGTMLGTSRGPVDVGVAVDNLVARGVNMLFTIGGDGTQRGGRAFYEEARKRSHPLAVVGIPKTIDNDVPFVKRSFGFTTAVDTACDIIDSAHTEAKSVDLGIGLVKLMGRHAGFIAAAATVANQDVNFCLIPEVPFRLDGEQGFLATLEERLRERRHAVIVVAEGAGQELIAGETGQKDASGNVVLQDVGPFLREKILAHFKARGMPALVRYIDPSYHIRGRAANVEDSVLCDRFARHAVHAAMAGKTGLIIGLVSGKLVHVPIDLLDTVQKRVEPEKELWQAVLAATGQPASMNG
jgi:6-phosphofructokinase 1